MYILISTLIFAGCDSPTNKQDVLLDSVPTRVTRNNKHATGTTIPNRNKRSDSSLHLNAKVYANNRFKNVTVENLGNNKFRLKGKAQIFEASFSWVIEDGHNELKNGYQMTDAGAPEWGNFDFVVEVNKKRQNSTLHIILFETSAKDGSRQYELPIKLY